MCALAKKMSTPPRASRAAWPPPPPPLPRQTRRRLDRPPTFLTSPGSSSSTSSPASTAPSTSFASRPSRVSFTPRSRWRASACGRKSAASSCRRSQRAVCRNLACWPHGFFCSVEPVKFSLKGCKNANGRCLHASGARELALLESRGVLGRLGGRCGLGLGLDAAFVPRPS